MLLVRTVPEFWERWASIQDDLRLLTLADDKPVLSAHLDCLNPRRETIDGVDLSHMNLTLWSLVGTKMRDARLDHSTFYPSVLTEADLSGLQCGGSTFLGCHAQRMSLEYSEFRTASGFDRCDLSGVRFSGSRFQSATIARSDLFDSDFSYCTFRNTIIERSDFDSRAALGFFGSSLDYCVFSECTGLQPTDFQDCLFKNTAFRSTQFKQGAQHSRPLSFTVDGDFSDFTACLRAALDRG